VSFCQRLFALAALAGLVGGSSPRLYAQERAPALRLDVLQTALVRRASPAVVGINCQAGEMSYYGTGVVIDAKGLVLTNLSVVPPQGAEIKIYFIGGKTAEAKVVEYDVKTESILLSMDPAPDGGAYPCVELADSDKATVGQRVYTFGNPFSIIETESQVAVAGGVISALGELTDNAEEPNQSRYVGPIIETDAAVNPGSDGGPILDSAGRLLGVMSLGIQRERLLGTCIPLTKICRNMKTLAERPLAGPPSEEISATGQALGEQALRLAPGVVWLEIEREEEAPFTLADGIKEMDQRGIPPGQQRGMMTIEYNKKVQMQRPPGLATGISIEGGRFVLTSAVHVTKLLKGKMVAGEAPNIKSLKVHAEGLTAPRDAVVVARQFQWDLALLEIKGDPLPASLELATAEDLVEGKSVGVVGRHRGSGRISMTAGIVSATGRNHNLVKVYQTDALVNYGNVGGPVLDLQGRVVGLATFINPEADFGLNSGVALFTGAHTIAAALGAMHQGETALNPTLPFLGIRGWDEKSIGGACVSGVYGGSAAERAGVLPGDLIISIDGKPIGEWSDLIRQITTKAVGQQIEFEVVRGEGKVKLQATLQKRTWNE